MLETIREYAGEREEESSRVDELRRQHGEFFLALAEDARNGMLDQSRQLVITRLEHEIANLRASLSWFRSAGQYD